MKNLKKHQRSQTGAETVVPFRPKKISFQYDRDERKLVFRQNRIGLARIGVGCFMTIWLTIWTIACVLLIVGVLNGGWGLLLFGIPFWASWVFVFGILMNIYFGRDYIQLDEEGLNYYYRVILTVSHRKVPLDEIRRFRVRTKQQSSDESNQTEFSVEAVTFGKPVGSSSVLLEEAEWMSQELNTMLARLKGAVLPDPEPLEEEPDALDDEEEIEDCEESALLIPMNSQAEDVEKPSDSRWQPVFGFDTVTFNQRGQFSLSRLGLTTFFNLFWNGMLSAFVLTLFGVLPDKNALIGGEWWLMFFFLIPFEVIGLALFLAWLATVFAPFFREQWTISRSAVQYRCSWFGIGPRWSYPLEECEAMQIDNDHRKTAWKIQFTPSSEEENQEAWKILFLDSQSQEICAIRGLTLGEAHWMTDMILKYQ